MEYNMTYMKSGKRKKEVQFIAMCLCNTNYKSVDSMGDFHAMNQFNSKKMVSA